MTYIKSFDDVSDEDLMQDILNSARIFAEDGINDYDSVFILAETAAEAVRRWKEIEGRMRGLEK